MGSARLGYVPALDGLRGIAIALVIGYHYFGLPAGGGQGVDLFFVLSGFLITTLLLEERAATGVNSLRGFYIRRARRLFPALAVVLLVFVALGGGIVEAAIVAGYAGNVALGFDLWPPLLHSALGPLWSLAEEEQFYLVWPIAMIALIRFRQALLPGLAALLVALIAYRIALVAAGASLDRVYYGPDVHSDGLVAGSLLAVIRVRRDAFAVPEYVAKLGCGLIVPAVILRLTIPEWQAYALPGVELACVFLIAAAVGGTELAGVLAARPLVWLGKISYSLYLWHLLVLDWVGVDEPLLALVLALAAATVSYRYIEQPFRRRRSRAPAVPSITVTAPT